MKKEEFKEFLVSAREVGRPPCFYHRVVTGLNNSYSLSSIPTKLKNKNIDGIEFDTQATSDGIIIVRHDFAIKYGKGYSWVKELTYKQLRSAVSEEDCPKLDTFIEALGDTYKVVDIEIKQNGIAKEIIKKYKKSKIYKQFIFTTMYEEIYVELIENDPEIAWMYGYPRDRGKNLTNRWWTQPIVRPAVYIIKRSLPNKIVGIMQSIPTEFFSFYHKVITKSLVGNIHKNGKFAIGATISLNSDTGKKESLEHMTKMLESGTDLIKTDYPDLYPAALKRNSI